MAVWFNGYMHEENLGLDPQTIEKDRKVAEELERENALEMIELEVFEEQLAPRQELPSYPERPDPGEAPKQSGVLRRLGRKALHFFTKEEFLFLRFRELPNNDLPDVPGEPSHG